VIIRLADEEDKMDLLVEEYKENGAKILDNISQKRAEERSKMLESLEEKKNTMITVYAATRKSISSSMGKLKQRPVGPLAKDWQTEQDFIRDKVGQGVEAD
jgi:restriction endonuclease S subunit